MVDYQKQFDIAHEVVEVSQSDGFKTLMSSVEQQLAQVQVEIDSINDDMLEAVRKEGVNSEKFVQRLIRLTARRDGLKFIISEVEHHKKLREEASKHID